MAKNDHKSRILQNHKKEGQKLIPPLTRLLNLKEISFQDNTLPVRLQLKITPRSANEINRGSAFPSDNYLN